jgi:hypothetical protein
VARVFKFIPTVEQPLKQLLPEELWNKIMSIVSGQEMLDSVLSCYYMAGA